MQEFDLPLLRQHFLWAVFGIGIAFGAISGRTHFCTMGAISDWVNFRDSGRLRMWFIAIGVAALGLQTMSVLGIARLGDTIFVGPTWNWLSGIVGGLLFGIGMVLASGCGSKTLIRAATGNLKALVVFVVLGIVSYMSLKGILASMRSNSLDLLKLHWESGGYLPTLLSGGSSTAQSGIAIGIPALILIASLASKQAWTKDTLLGGFGIGLCGLLMWFAVFVLAYVPEHPDTLEPAYIGTYNNRAEAMSFVAPYAYSLEWLMFYTDQSRVLTMGVVALGGIMLGALLNALLEGSFRWETFQGVEDTANHLVGAALMGFGGVLAMGCTIGQGLSGVSTLALGSWVTLASIMIGAVVAIKYQIWRIEKLA